MKRLKYMIIKKKKRNKSLTKRLLKIEGDWRMIMIKEKKKCKKIIYQITLMIKTINNCFKNLWMEKLI